MKKDFNKRMITDYTYLAVALLVLLVAIIIIKGLSGFGSSEKNTERLKLQEEALLKVDPENR